jgi:hypothetical protein
VRVVLVLRFGNECEPPAGCEGLVLQRIGAIGDTRNRDDPNARIVLPDVLLARRVPQAEAAAAALEPESEAASAQNSSRRRAASSTRSTDGM